VGAVSLAYWSGWPYGKIPSLRVPRSMATPEAPVERVPAYARPVDAGTREAAQPLEVVGGDAWHRVIARLLRLWGVGDELTREQIAAWPTDADGSPEIRAIAARYQLAVALLSDTSLAELKAIGLPALLEVGDSTGKRPFLLRRIHGDGVVLLTPSGDEVRHTPESLEPLWDGTARVLWRNVDDLPSDPSQEMTPPVLTTVALRLYKLGHLAPPLPSGYSARLERAVRDFQREVGLPEDGVVGPKTTLALSRVVGGRFNPTVVER
jgi:hypothetical protein